MIRLNCGISRKVGQANFGSRGGSIHLEVELADLDNNKLKESIHRLFHLAKESLEQELGGEVHEGKDKPVVQISTQPTGQTLQEAISTQAKLVSGKQLNFLQTLARSQRRDLQKEVLEAYETFPERLTCKQASALIEKWRNAPVMAR